MMKSSQQIVTELSSEGIAVQWHCEPTNEMYGTIEVTDDVHVRVHDTGYVKVLRHDNGAEVWYSDQPETIEHLAYVIEVALVDSEIGAWHGKHNALYYSHSQQREEHYEQT